MRTEEFLKFQRVRFAHSTPLVDVGFKNRGVKRANFQVLRDTKAPAVLVEVGFIDHSGDNRLFDTKRDKIVCAMASAILGQVVKLSQGKTF